MKTNSKFINDDHGMLDALPAIGLVIIIAFSILFVGTFINGTISGSLMPTTPDDAFEWRTNNTFRNLTGGYEDVVDIVTVAMLITVLTIPLMAIVAIKKLI